MRKSAPDPSTDPAVQRALALLGCSDRDDLAIGGVPATELVAQFGSPLYAFDADLLAARTRSVQLALGRRVQLLYSIKANPGLAVTALLRTHGLGAEIASLGELQLARAAGHAAAELRFAGPGKTDADIDGALRAGVGCFHVESPSEVDAIAAAARTARVRAGVAVRVNLRQQLHGARLRMGGTGARFGVDEAEVPLLLRRIAGDDALELRGLHVYGGTQCFLADAFAAAAATLCDLADRWQRQLDLTLCELDLGGGFGVPTYLGDPEFDLGVAAARVQQLVAQHDQPQRRWFVELGRYLLAPAGVYLARVARSKQAGGRTHLVLDGGMHHCAVAAGLGSVLRRPPLLVAATALRAATREPVAVGGPLCTPQDQFAGSVSLPPCREGDLLAVLAVGAYGQSYSPTGFLSHATPAEVLVEGGRARVVRARGEPADVLRGQSV